jgi:hypothetical protein
MELKAMGILPDLTKLETIVLYRWYIHWLEHLLLVHQEKIRKFVRVGIDFSTS